ncbi:MAG: hypothetical protein IH878_03340 [Gemmatimonadetes bacterium]|nr:hypothetical protein [Gemmatimonadota bacterium]
MFWKLMDEALDALFVKCTMHLDRRPDDFVKLIHTVHLCALGGLSSE